MFVGIGINPDATELLTKRDDGMFVGSDRTMKKLAEANVNGTTEEKQLLLVCAMFQYAYSLMMADADVILEGQLFHQFIGPIKT